MSAEPSNIITVDDHRLVELITVGQYGYANKNIVEYRTILKDGAEIQDPVFPHDPSENGKWKWSFWSPPRWMSTDQVRYEIEQGHRRLARIRQLAAFGAAHPNEQISGPIIGLGSVCRIGGRSCSPGLWRGGGGRGLGLYSLGDGWGPYCRFLCVEPVDSVA